MNSLIRTALEKGPCKVLLKFLQKVKGACNHDRFNEGLKRSLKKKEKNIIVSKDPIITYCRNNQENQVQINVI